jgi:hypothetical protein
MKAIKLIIIFILSLCLLSLVGCSSHMAPQPETTPNNNIEISGVLTSDEFPLLMYGSHVLTTQDGEPLYALESTSVDLDSYIGDTIQVKGEPIEGYPLNSGEPPLLQVSEASHIK